MLPAKYQPNRSSISGEEFVKMVLPYKGMTTILTYKSYSEAGTRSAIGRAPDL